MKTQINQRARRDAAYTLIEVAVATTIMLIGVGAACVLSLTMISQEETHGRSSRAANLMENAVRMYHLGINPDLIFATLPPDPMVKTFTSTTQSQPFMSGIGAPNYVSFTMAYYPSSDTTVWTPGTWGGRPDTAISGNVDHRTLGPLRAYRNSFRP